MKVYADNAATTKLDYDAFESMKPFLLNEFGNASQPYSFSRSPKKALQEARQTIAECINAEPDEIFFTSGGTESDNWAIKGTIVGSSKDREGVVSSTFEHHAVLKSCELIENLGYPVEYVTPNSEGFITVDALESKISNKTLLVSIMMSNNEIGTVQPIRELACVAHKYGAYIHTDAVQCVGHISVDVKKLNVDMLSASAHKFNGPKGIGFLYIRKGVKISPLLNGGSQESGNRAGTENVSAIVGMAVALKKNCEKMQENYKYVLDLEKTLISLLQNKNINFIRNGKGETIPGNISLSFPGFEGEALLHRLDLMGIQVSTGSACDSINNKISHVLKSIKLNEKFAKGTIRISLSRENTLEEINYIAEAISKIISA